MKPLATKTKNEIVSGVGKPRASLVSHFGSQGREPDVGCISGQWLGFVNQRQAFEDFLFQPVPFPTFPLSRACPFSSPSVHHPGRSLFPDLSPPTFSCPPSPTFPPGPVPFLPSVHHPRRGLSRTCPLRPSLPSDPLLSFPFMTRPPPSFLPLRLSLRLSSGFSKPDRALSPCLDLSPSRTDLSPSRTFSPSLCHVVDVCR